jgi:hypothetical protein
MQARKNDANRATLRNLLGLARKLVLAGGAASHLGGLALRGSDPRRERT